MVKLFLNENPDLSLRDKKGRTALERAKSLEKDIEMQIIGQRESFSFGVVFRELLRKSEAIITSINLIQNKLNSVNHSTIT